MLMEFQGYGTMHERYRICLLLADTVKRRRPKGKAENDFRVGPITMVQSERSCVGSMLDQPLVPSWCRS